MKKRIIAVFTAVLLVVTMMPVMSVLAEDEQKLDLENAKIEVWDETYDGSEGWFSPEVNYYFEDDDMTGMLDDGEDFDYVFLDENDNEIPTYRAGTFRIKITAREGSNYCGEKYSEWFTIAKAPQAVKVSKTKYTKFYGDKKFKLGAKRTKGKGKLVFKSSNTKVVSVSSTGVVTVKKTKKAKTVKISIYAAETANYRKSPVKTVTIKVYPKQKTPKAYKKYLGKWIDDDFKIYVKVINKNYVYAVMKANNGDYVVIKKLMKVKKMNKLSLKSKKGEEVTLYIKMRATKAYKLPNGIVMKEGPTYWCNGTSKAWWNGSYAIKDNGKWRKVYLTFYRILKK